MFIRHGNMSKISSSGVDSSIVLVSLFCDSSLPQAVLITAPRNVSQPATTTSTDERSDRASSGALTVSSSTWRFSCRARTWAVPPFRSAPCHRVVVVAISPAANTHCIRSIHQKNSPFTSWDSLVAYSVGFFIALSPTVQWPLAGLLFSIFYCLCMTIFSQ